MPLILFLRRMQGRTSEAFSRSTTLEKSIVIMLAQEDAASHQERTYVIGHARAAVQGAIVYLPELMATKTYAPAMPSLKHMEIGPSALEHVLRLLTDSIRFAFQEWIGVHVCLCVCERVREKILFSFLLAK